jgi:sulfate adenylyltransferase subunit 1
MKKNYSDIELLRFTTAGSVDDGKSTLIGRLLYDSNAIFEDHLEHIKGSSKRNGSDQIDLSLITDGLKDEREQGITIDVAYRYFATPKRKFIIADTPGHIQYTRNMVTGASTSNAALILVDGRKGVVEQTCRHSFLASLLQIPHIVVCVNKMDLVNYDEDIFQSVVEQYDSIASKLAVKDISFIPISALKGDNVVTRSEKMEWYHGATLLNILENIHIGSDDNLIDTRFPVQTVIRPQTDEYHDFRGYAGRIDGGNIRVGDEIQSLPNGLKSVISKIYLGDKKIEEAFAPMSVTLTLTDDIDISRGNMLVKPNNLPQIVREFYAMLCWFNETPLNLNKKYLLRHTTANAICKIQDVIYKINISTLTRNIDDKTIIMNDIFKVKIRTNIELFIDPYQRNRKTGSIILIDEATHETVAGGIVDF